MRPVASLLLILMSLSVASADPFIVIVRHAEKANNSNKNPDLSPAGLARANALTEMLKDSRIIAIFTSEFKRTAQTAAPTAKALHINPTVVPASDTATLVAKLRQLKGNALVVGHGNSIPGLVKTLGIKIPVEIAESDYTQLLVVTLGPKPQLLRLHLP